MLKVNRLFGKYLIYLILITILLLHVLILTKLIFFPYPELFIYPYLTNHGLKPYQQILDQHFPGLMFLPINFDNLGMKNDIIARWWSITTVIVTQLLLFAISSKILKDQRKALLVNFLYLTWQPFFEGWVLWIDSFLPLLLLPAFYLLYRNKLFWCGLFLGMGIIFKQTLIPLFILILIYICWQNRSLKQVIIFLLGFLAPILLMLGYLVSIGVMKDFLYWTVVFNLTTYAKSGTSFPTTVGFITRVLLVYFASVFPWFNKDRKLVNSLSIFLLGSLMVIFDRANFVHYQPSLPFAVLGTSLGIYQFYKKKIFRIFILVYTMTAIWWLIIFYKGHLLSKVFFFDSQTKITANKIIQYTKKGDKIFIFGAPPHLYQMADRLPAGNIFVFQFPWFLKVAKDRILNGIKSDKPSIVITDRTMEIEGQKIIDYAEGIDQYIQKNYQVIDSVGTTQILQLKSN